MRLLSPLDLALACLPKCSHITLAKFAPRQKIYFAPLTTVPHVAISDGPVAAHSVTLRAEEACVLPHWLANFRECDFPSLETAASTFSISDGG